MLDTDAESQKLSSDVEQPFTASQLKKKSNCIGLITQRVFILSWIRTYGKDAILSDMIAGTTVGLTMIAQAIAYAALAGLPSQYGLYSAFVGKYTEIHLWKLQYFI